MTSIKSLTLEELLTVYFIVEPHIPKDANLTIYDACSKIFDALTGDEFISCICILTGIDRDKIIREDALDYFISFVEGIKENNILAMQLLFRQIGFID